jgi:ketosteroid isomerase-like protein
MNEPRMRSMAEALIAAFNAGDADAVVALFSPDAVIDDPSTGHRFYGHVGVRDYVEQFFVDYHTVSELLDVSVLPDTRFRVRVDFTGDFGHETGRLDIKVDGAGRITRIDADLE